MDNFYIPFTGDAEASEWLDDLVGKGLVEELYGGPQTERCFRMTDKGNRLLQVTNELSALLGTNLSRDSMIEARKN